MSPAQEQFRRVERYLERLEHKGASDQDTDALYSFFLHAWHLIDWTANDPTVTQDYQQVKTDAQVLDSIKRCEDIANGTKHLVLDKPPRTAPTMTHKHIQAWEDTERTPVASYTFTFPDGSTRDALVLARQVVADWRSLLVTYGVSVSAA